MLEVLVWPKVITLNGFYVYNTKKVDALTNRGRVYQRSFLSYTTPQKNLSGSNCGIIKELGELFYKQAQNMSQDNFVVKI
jgi:hypothetical protein